MTNLEIVQLLRKIAAAYQILNENKFKIIAYDRAADSIEHLTSEVKDLWNDGKLKDITGVGDTIAKHLDELFRTGSVSHFETVLKKLPASVFPLLSVPGIGPKRAHKLVTILQLHNEQSVIGDLEKAARKHLIAPIVGFGEKSESEILNNISVYRHGQTKENRMILSEADTIACTILGYLFRIPETIHADTLGSLRRKVATIGDIDIAVATNNPEIVIDHFIKYPHQKIIEKGSTGASLLLHMGRQVDLRIQKPEAYGAMLQYFTGSKNHNIKLRAYAQSQGKSLNEYGIKYVKNNTLTQYSTEKDLYNALQMDFIPPELREDKGEIDASLTHTLPRLVNLTDIKGDLHIHSDYHLEPSHDIGVNSVHEYLTQAASLGYEYIGFSDHNPSVSNHTSIQIIDIMKRRKDYFEQQYYSWVKNLSKNSNRDHKNVKMIIMCEVDILSDGQTALPVRAYEYVDAVIASVHSSFSDDRNKMTRRVLTALSSHPKIRIFGHPTTRMLGKREGIEYDWEKIFSYCKSNGTVLEINAHPVRLDLPDNIVFDAKKQGIRFCINSDAHAADQMRLMEYGISVARRGWAIKDDIVNSLSYNEITKWLLKGDNI